MFYEKVTRLVIKFSEISESKAKTFFLQNEIEKEAATGKQNFFYLSSEKLGKI